MSNHNTISVIPPETDRFRAQRRKSSSSFRHKRSSHRQLRWVAWWASCLISIALALFFGLKISLLRGENQELLVQLRKAERELDRLGPELKAARERIDTLVTGRLPNLKKLEYDKVIAVGERYIKNIVFTVLKKWREVNYEYKLVMQNDELSPVRPRVDLLLFNELGIQVAKSRVEEEGHAPEGSGGRQLDPGEGRSYSSILKLPSDAAPTYFMLRIATEGALQKKREIPSQND